MEKKSKSKEKSFGHDSFQKIFLLSSHLEEPKLQKDWFTGQLQKYMSTIKHDVDNITKEGRYDRLRKKISSNSYSQNRINVYSDKKLNRFFQISKGNKFNLKKFSKFSNKYLNILPNNNNNVQEITKSDSLTNLNSRYPYEYKNKTVGTNINDNDNDNENDNSNQSLDINNNNNDENTKSKFNLKLRLGSSTLPNIPRLGNKKKYITKYINNISNETDSLEKKLIRQERMKYIGFKSKYNRLFNEYKKVQIDIDQYVNPQKDKRYKFNLNNTGAEISDQGNITKVMRQISLKLKNKYENKPSIHDIINEVQNFKFREKRLRERIKKNHDKFDYLINDSNIIQKRIDIKCQKSTDFN